MNEVEAIFVTALAATIIAIWGIVTTRVVARRVATMDRFTRIATDKDMIAAREKFIELTEQPGGLAAYADDNPFGRSEEIKAIRTILNDFEQLALGIQFGVLDLELIKRYHRTGIIRDWGHAAPFIYKLRAKIGSPAIYHEFEELARSLQTNRMPSRNRWTRLWF
ncbi:MAG TPA: DUF4760 domain-containing protein [Sphingomonas sp.]|nr:DUF4760 domain-containing protein [Sphingomonas sp.]